MKNTTHLPAFAALLLHAALLPMAGAARTRDLYLASRTQSCILQLGPVRPENSALGSGLHQEPLKW